MTHYLSVMRNVRNLTIPIFIQPGINNSAQQEKKTQSLILKAQTMNDKVACSREW